MQGLLALEDGRIFEGDSFGMEGIAEGEIVFNTSMTGYQEVLTDPSYNGQIVAMTYPLIGNYGIHPSHMESERVRVKGFVVREFCPFPSHFRSQDSLQNYLIRHGIVAITEIDTRALTKHIRTRGAMRAVIAGGPSLDPARLVQRAKESPGLVGRDLVSEVACDHSFSWTEPCPWFGQGQGRQEASFTASAKRRHKVLAYDFGLKHNILRCLYSAGCQVVVVPASTRAEEVLEQRPDGIFLSNGPGDPEGVPAIISEIRRLLGKVPIFGICLGQQLLGLAFGAKTYKLKFGHRGANHPVKNLKTGQVEITVQNHGFCVDPDSILAHGLEVTHINLNDNTLEGMRHKELPAFSVQYHPEAAAGPHDSEYLFRQFAEMMENHHA